MTMACRNRSHVANLVRVSVEILESYVPDSGPLFRGSGLLASETGRPWLCGDPHGLSAEIGFPGCREFSLVFGLPSSAVGAQAATSSRVFPFSATSRGKSSREISAAVQGIRNRIAGNFRWRSSRRRSEGFQLEKSNWVYFRLSQRRWWRRLRRPPVSSRWKAGHSDNPRGRRPSAPPHPEQFASDQEIEYKAGYRQPPRHSRWKPGQAGNPGGGPRRDILEEVLLSPFPVKIGRNTEMVAALDVMLLRIRAKALAGDQKVIRSLIEHFGSPKLESQLTRRSSNSRSDARKVSAG